jgi:hypothetical protein
VNTWPRFGEVLAAIRSDIATAPKLASAAAKRASAAPIFGTALDSPGQWIETRNEQNADAVFI